MYKDKHKMKCGKFIAGYLTFISPKQNERREKIIFSFMCRFLYVLFSITIFSAISLNLSTKRFQYFSSIWIWRNLCEYVYSYSS